MVSKLYPFIILPTRYSSFVSGIVLSSAGVAKEKKKKMVCHKELWFLNSLTLSKMDGHNERLSKN